MMLDERRAVALVYDAANDTAQVAVAAPIPNAAKLRTVAGALLLDAAGFLVGLDLRDPDGRGVVVMVGSHEAVASTQDYSLDVLEDSGEVSAVTVRGARKAMRAADKNPYI